MSTTAKGNSNTAEAIASISEAEDMKMFQAARRNGRRNALGDLSEQLAQGKFRFSYPFSSKYRFSTLPSSQCFKFIFRR